jgi:hypothetical protein
MERAQTLDQHLAETGELVGPLHGLPISLKVRISTAGWNQRKLTSQDCFHVADQYATAGYVEYLKRPVPTDNSALVSLLLDAGAILYCKTNIPQTMMVSDMLLGPESPLCLTDCVRPPTRKTTSLGGLSTLTIPSSQQEVAAVARELWLLSGVRS